MTNQSAPTRLISLYPSQRSVSKTYGSLSGLYSFNGIGHIPFESKLEKDFLVRLSTMSNVLDVISQPITLPYVTDSGKSSCYTPDFLVKFKPYPYLHRKDVIVEVKPSTKLKKDWTKLKPKFKSAMRICRREGMKFSIFNENRIRDERWQNGSMLSNFKNVHFHNNDLDIALAILDEAETLSIFEFINELNKVGIEKKIALRKIYHLISIKKIACDLSRLLTNETEIWVNEL